MDGEGQIYHAFREVCDKVFSGIPKATLCSRMRLLNVSLVWCPANVQERIRKARPQLAGLKVISLIAKRDLSVLEAYHQSRSAKCFEVCSTNPLESRANVEKSRQNSAFLKLEMDFSQGARGKLPALSPFPKCH